jgi:hypothetical protein
MPGGRKVGNEEITVPIKELEEGGVLKETVQQATQTALSFGQLILISL